MVEFTEERLVYIMTDKSFDFESEYTSDEEIESDMDALMLSMAEEIEQDESRTSIINPYRMKELAFTYKSMKYITHGSKAKVTYKLHEPYQSMGSVSVTGKNIVFSNMSWFVRAVEMASNFEVYPKTNGDICMTFTFHGLTTPIE